MSIDFLSNGPESAERTLILAHGAGAAMDSPFMEHMAKRLAADGIRVLRFEFPYMARRRVDGSRRAPDREPVLLETWREAVRDSSAKAPFFGGKSMGGRMASMVADEVGAAGLVCLGYPFHPPGKPEKLRTAHLESLKTPALIVQGTNDAFGTRDDVAGYALSKAITLHWVEGGNHDLVAKGTPKGAGWDAVAAAVASFVARRG